MNSFLGLLKKLPYWFWIAVVVAIILFWQSLSGWAMSRKLYNMALGQLREDKTQIVEELEKDNKEKEKAISDLQKKVLDVQRQRAAAEAESKRLVRLVDEKNAEILKLKKEREAIIVPTDPNALADEFRKRGYRPRVILPIR